MAKSVSCRSAAIVAARMVLFGLIAAASGLTLVSCAGSGPKISEAIRSAPSMNAVSGLNDKLLWILSHAVSGGEYTVALDSDEGGLTNGGNLTFKKKSGIANVAITIKSTGETRTISPAHFRIGSGVTLILDSNITLQGPPMDDGDGTAPSNNSAVFVASGGTFVMNGGSAIIGNSNNFGIHGGGVQVWAGGAFHMNGGTISGNKCIAGKSLIKATVWGDAIGNVLGAAASSKLSQQDNKNARAIGKSIGDATVSNIQNPNYPVSKGGGVYVHGIGVALFGKPDPAGVFVKTGGTITGYDSDPEDGNVAMDGGWPINGLGSAATPYIPSATGGHAMYFGGSGGIEPKTIDITIGPEVHIEFRDGIYRETLSEKPEPAEIAAEAEPSETEPPEDSDAETAVSAAEPVEAVPEPQAQYAPPVQAAPPLRREPPMPPPEPTPRASGDGIPHIAAYVFGAEDPALNRAMATRLMATLSTSGRYHVLDEYKEFLNKAEEERRDSAAYMSAERIKRLGRQFGAEYVCVAEICKAFGEYQAVAHILDVESGRVAAAGAGDIPLKALVDLTAAAEQIVEAMFKTGKRATLPVVSASSRIIYADGAFTDNRDGRTYRKIKVGGDKAWMAENLNYPTQEGSWCYENGESNCDRYGRLYDWKTANAVCPDGWRLPSNREWETLVAAAGGQSAAAAKLKAKTGWNDGGGGTNDYGFAALPGGRRLNENGVFFENLSTDGHWWTATSGGTNFAYTRNMSHRLNNVYVNFYDNKNNGLSVRCVQE